MSEWYYAKNQQQLGPVSKDELLAKLESGELAATDLAWTDSMAEWTAIGKISALQSAAPAAVPPPSPSASPASATSAVPAAESTPYQSPKTSAESAAPSYQTPAPPAGTNGFAVTTLILGFLAVICLVVCIGPLFGIVGIVFGHIALVKIKHSEPRQSGRGLAITGLVLNYLSVLACVVIAGFFFWLFSGLETTGPDGQPLPEDEVMEVVLDRFEEVFGTEITEEVRRSVEQAEAEAAEESGEESSAPAQPDADE